jgi:tetratricopeptide (TPR) repeat protein
MKKSVLNYILAGVMLTGLVAEAKPLAAELVMRGGRSWKGQIVNRDGEWIEFSTGTAAQPIRLGASTVQELIFAVDIDAAALVQMNQNREYAQAITLLEQALKPYAIFSDIPSNLTLYNGQLMELYFKTGAYDKTLQIADTVAKDDRDPALQRKSKVFQGLALIEANRVEEAEALFAAQGWTADLPDDAPPEDLYITAKFMVAKKEYARAIEIAAKVVAFNSQDPEWLRPAELLCAEIYTELGMLDSADEVIRQITLLYKNTDEEEQARKLKIRVDGLRAGL